VRAAPAHPTFKPLARAKLAAWIDLTLRAKLAARPGLILWANLPTRIELTLWADLALHSRPGLEVLWPVVALRPIKAPALRLHTATQCHKERQPPSAIAIQPSLRPPLPSM
jgi:hypothetical protein